MTNRRQFILTLIPAAVLIGSSGSAAAEPAHILETDATAVALNYKKDVSNIDTAKVPAYVKGSRCGNCQLYQGVASAAAGACPIMGGKLVDTIGWCSAYNRKA